jgi:hypothetical protein
VDRIVPERRIKPTKGIYRAFQNIFLLTSPIFRVTPEMQIVAYFIFWGVIARFLNLDLWDLEGLKGIPPSQIITII